MSYSICLLATMATMILGTEVVDSEEGNDSAATLDDTLASSCERLRELVERFRTGAVSPLATAKFEKDVQQALREEGRLIVEWACNHLEPADAQAAPRQVRFEGSSYRRLSRKTPQAVSTLFGTICLRRLGYRAAAR